MSGQSIITIGNFDGVHAGHRAIVRSARELADEQSARVVAVTFDPPPVAVLKPGLVPPQVASLADRRRWLIDAGADEVVVATGAERGMPDIPGSEQDFVFSGGEMRALVLAEKHPELLRKTSTFTRFMAGNLCN